MWLEEAKQNGNPNLQFILLGNKSDQAEGNNASKRQVTFDEGQDLANKHKINFLEVSAKNGTNIEQAFLQMTYIISDKIQCGELSTNVNINK